MENYIHLVVEDELTFHVTQSVFHFALPEQKFKFIEMIKGGKGKIKTKLAEYNRSAKKLSFCLVIDLDDNECAPSLIDQWFKFAKNERLFFRVAVKEIEAWVLADYKNFSKFLNVSPDVIKKKIPNLEADNILDPKETLLQITNAKSKIARKENIVFVSEGKFYQGSAYNSEMSNFIHSFWNVKFAAQNSNSLQKAIKAIQTSYKTPHKT